MMVYIEAICAFCSSGTNTKKPSAPDMFTESDDMFAADFDVSARVEQRNTILLFLPIRDLIIIVYIYTSLFSFLHRVLGLGLLELAKTLRKTQISGTTGLMLRDIIVSVRCQRM